MQKEINYANIWSFVALCLVAVLTIGLFAGWFMPEQEEVVVPTSGEIAAQVLTNIDIPTAAEIAAQIDIPEVDTFYSVRDDKEAVAEELAEDELNDRDFMDDLANYIENQCDGTDSIDRKDITSISIRDTDTNGFGQHATVEFELKVYYDNYGDDEESESARVQVNFYVDDLDRDDDYEDAEVTGYNIVDFLSCTTD